MLPTGQSLDEQLFVDFVASEGIIGAPIIETSVRLVANDTRVTLLGVDAIEEAGFRDATRLGMLGGVASELLISLPSTAIVPSSLLETAAADTITIATQSGTHELSVVGVLPADAGVTNLIVVDIATAQEVTGMLGRLTRIDLILDAEALGELRDRAPPNTALVGAGTEDQAFRQLSNAFRINILALGLLALAVGMFLVYSSANFSLIRRARTFGILRTLGIKKSELGFGIVQEFILLGVLASLLGVALGHALADVLVDLMLLTVSDFSFRNEVAVNAADPGLYAKGMLLGVSGTLAAAFGPIQTCRATRLECRFITQRAGVARSQNVHARHYRSAILTAARCCAADVADSKPGRCLCRTFRCACCSCECDAGHRNRTRCRA